MDADGVAVAVAASRAQLRHRVWRTTAFVTVTNEKRHNGVTMQHVLNEQLKHWADHSAAPAAQQEIEQRLAAATAAAAPQPQPHTATAATQSVVPTLLTADPCAILTGLIR